LNKQIIIAGSGYITAEIYETAILLGYDVINLDLLGRSKLVGTKIMSPEAVNEEILLLPIIMSTVDYPEHENLPMLRKAVENRLKLFHELESLGFSNWVSLVHPSAVISASAKIGINVFINANSTLANNSNISDSTQINRNVSIGHDVVVGRFCNIAPGVTITGGAQIKDKVFIGAGAIVINAVNVGFESTVAAGSVVTRNVDNATLVIGSPARPRE